MSELRMKGDGSPYATAEAAKSARTRMGSDGIDWNVVNVDGGFALEHKPYNRPKERIPLGTRNVLGISKKKLDTKNYKYRIVNDIGDRLERFRDAGWEPETTTDQDTLMGDEDVGNSRQFGSLVTKPVDKNGTIAYLMKIKREFYEEDEEAKAEKIRQTEADLRFDKTQNPDRKGRYGEVKIGR
jgi:hypothetical protein